MEHSERDETRISGDALQRLLSTRSEFLAFLEKRVGSRAVAEDLLQNAFVKAIDKAELKDQENVVAWFYRVLRNALIDYYRSNASSARTIDSFAREVKGAHIPSPDLRDEICRCVSHLLQDLKPEYREVLQAVDMEENSVSEVAANVGISANNATVRLHRARQALRKQVMITCGTCAEHGCVDCRCKGRSSFV